LATSEKLESLLEPGPESVEPALDDELPVLLPFAPLLPPDPPASLKPAPEEPPLLLPPAAPLLLALLPLLDPLPPLIPLLLTPPPLLLLKDRPLLLPPALPELDPAPTEELDAPPFPGASRAASAWVAGVDWPPHLKSEVPSISSQTLTPNHLRIHTLYQRFRLLTSHLRRKALSHRNLARHRQGPCTGARRGNDYGQSFRAGARAADTLLVEPDRQRLGRVTALVIGALLGLACVTVHPRIRSAHQAASGGPAQPARLDPQVVAATMARLRGVAYDEGISVHMLEGPEFIRQLHAHDSAPPSTALPNRFWTAFHFSADEQVAARATHSATDASIAGFYDPSRDELYVRRTFQSATSERFTVAHEVAHGVQHRLGVMPYSGAIEEGLARRALVEGDADLMAAAYLAMQAHRSVGVSVARLGDAMKKMSVSDLTEVLHESPSVASAPPLVRARMFFPYVEGTAFATAIYQSGGFALLNAALAHPPVTTEQVLHPKKYLAGEGAIPVSAPVVDGVSIVDQGTLGELQTGVYLSQCMDPRNARQAAEGWGGDAYTIAVDDSGAPAVLWRTVWDNEEAAERFEEAVRARDHCGEAVRAPVTYRRGTSVGVVDAPDPGRFSSQSVLAPAQPVRSPQPPLGKVALRTFSAPETQFLHQGRLTDRTFTSSALGLSVDIPAGFWGDTPPYGGELTMDEHSTSGGVLFVFEPDSAELESQVAEKLATSAFGLKTGFAGKRRAYQMDLPAGRAEVQELVVGAFRLLAAFVAACDGQAVLVLYSVWPDEWLGSGAAIAESWLDGVRLSDDSPACRYLSVLDNAGALAPGGR
jgi:hypothetical protein